MEIPIVLQNGNEAKVPPRILDELLITGQVLFFKRSGSWVVIGRDRIRSKSRRPYAGRERRGQSSVRSPSH